MKIEVIENIESVLPLFQITSEGILLSVANTEMTIINKLSVPIDGSEIEKSSQDENTLEIVSSPYKSKRQRSTAPKFTSNKDVDHAGREARNKELGLLGEKLVISFEHKKLIESGRNDLAEKIKHISIVLGDNAGYDLESYTPEGNIKYIEVKTTKGVKTSSFFMSSHELDFAKQNKDSYYLYRVFEYRKKSNNGKCFIVTSIEDELVFSPIQYIVTL